MPRSAWWTCAVRVAQAALAAVVALGVCAMVGCTAAPVDTAGSGAASQEPAAGTVPQAGEPSAGAPEVERVKTPVGTAWRLTRPGSAADGMTWGQAMSPDGRHVAYLTLSRFDPDKYLRMRNRLTVCRADGTDPWVAIDAIRNNCAKMHLVPRVVWTADGTTLYCINNTDPWGMGPVRVWKVDVAARKVTDLGVFLKDLTYVLMRACLGPGGKSLAFASSDHRLHQVDPGHNFYPVVLVTPEGREVRTEAKYKDVLASPLGGTVIGVDAVRRELRRIAPDGSATTLHTYGKDQFVVRLHFGGETGNVLMVSARWRDRKAWKPTMGSRNNPVFNVWLVNPQGEAAEVKTGAFQDSIVPLPQDDAVLVGEIGKPYVAHPFAKTRRDLDLTGPVWAAPSPSAEVPCAVLRSITKSADGHRTAPVLDHVTLLNWQTGKSVRLEGRPFDALRWPVSWSADGRWLAFSRAPGKGSPVEVPKMIDPPHDFIGGEIWVLRLSEEIGQ